MSHRAPPPMTREEAAEFHGEPKAHVQECPKCGTFHSGYSPALCFACAVGLKRRSS